MRPWDDGTDKKELEVALFSGPQNRIHGKTVVAILKRMFPIWRWWYVVSMKFWNFWCGRRHGRSSHRRRFFGVQLGAKLNRNVYLSMPCVASPMDTVTELAMPTIGGVRITHSSNSAAECAALVRFLQVVARSFRAGSSCEARILFGGFGFGF